MAGMKRKLVLLAAAGAAVWMLALLDFRAREPVTAAQEEPPAAVADQSPQASARRHARATQDTQPVEEPAAPEPVAARKAAASSSPMSGVMRAAQGTVAVIGNAVRGVWRGGHRQAAAPVEDDAPAQPPQVRATGEIGQGTLSPGYAATEQKFAGEARDGAWASAQEQRVRELLQPQAWSDRVSVVNCQQSTCRIMIETDSETNEPFRQLVGVPGLSDAAGIVAGTPYSMRNGQLSLYFTPPALPDQPSAEHASK
jgi:hypothetical protein